MRATVFRKLKLMGEYRRRHMPFLRTLDDQDLVREIGYHQEVGKPLTLKVLLLAGIASTATVQRRLARLRSIGVVKPVRAAHDGRVVKLKLSQRTLALFRKMDALIRAPLGRSGHQKIRGRADRRRKP